MKGIGFKFIPVIILVLFVVMMTSGSYLKQSFSSGDDVMYHMENVKKSVKDDEWEEAASDLKKTHQAWKKVVPRIQFSSERDNINTLTKTLERTSGFISAEDKAGALSELAEARHLWNELGK